MYNILCYGDSNTWGYIPGSAGRYEASVRWTGVAQLALGAEYRIIEEGLNGRTTIFDSPYNDQLNGKKHLTCALLSHAPLDLVALMLGTNDLQHSYGAWEAASGCATLIKMILSSPLSFVERKPKVLLISPILVGENIADVDFSPIRVRGREESLRFAAQYRLVADRYGVDFMDAATYASPSPIDGTHMSAQGHAALGNAVAAKIREVLQNTPPALN